MTTEEAIKTIETAISEIEWNYPMNYTVAFEMAIQALRNDCDELQQKYKDAIQRQGDFGRLFVDYRGCPRGPLGRWTIPRPIEKEVLSMPVITDVDGGRWIPVNADALRELVNEYRMLKGMKPDGGVSDRHYCRECDAHDDEGWCWIHNHTTSSDDFCEHWFSKAVLHEENAGEFQEAE